MKKLKDEMVAHVYQVASFVGNLVGGALLFLALLVVTVVIDKAGAYLAMEISDPYVGAVLTLTGRILFTLDVCLLLGWVVYSLLKSIRPRR